MKRILSILTATLMLFCMSIPSLAASSSLEIDIFPENQVVATGGQQTFVFEFSGAKEWSFDDDDIVTRGFTGNITKRYAKDNIAKITFSNVRRSGDATYGYIVFNGNVKYDGKEEKYVTRSTKFSMARAPKVELYSDEKEFVEGDTVEFVFTVKGENDSTSYQSCFSTEGFTGKMEFENIYERGEDDKTLITISNIKRNREKRSCYLIYDGDIVYQGVKSNVYAKSNKIYID